MIMLISEFQKRNNKHICKYLLILLIFILKGLYIGLRNSYTMGCPPVRGDNPRALASGLSYVQVDKHGITIILPTSV